LHPVILREDRADGRSQGLGRELSQEILDEDELGKTGCAGEIGRIPTERQPNLHAAYDAAHHH
jgi:hypothetical protein